MADFPFSEIEAAVNWQVARDALGEGRSVALGPDPQVGDAHPGQVLPARQVHARQVNVEEDQRKHEESEGGANQECHIQCNLVLAAQRIYFIFSHVIDSDANE